MLYGECNQWKTSICFNSHGYNNTYSIEYVEIITVFFLQQYIKLTQESPIKTYVQSALKTGVLYESNDILLHEIKQRTTTSDYDFEILL